MSLRSDWERAKKSVQPPIPKGFFGNANLGPLLDKMESTEKDYEKLPGTTDHEKLKKAKRKAYDACLATDVAISTYLKQVKMAKNANKTDQKLMQALDTIETFLSMKLATSVDAKKKILKS